MPRTCTDHRDRGELQGLLRPDLQKSRQKCNGSFAITCSSTKELCKNFNRKSSGFGLSRPRGEEREIRGWEGHARAGE
jgi:hypothetical protein